MIDALGNLAVNVGPQVLRRTGDTPLSFAGRLVGLGAREQAAGIPKWGWFGVGMVAGATAMWVFKPELEKVLRLGG